LPQPSPASAAHPPVASPMTAFGFGPTVALGGCWPQPEASVVDPTWMAQAMAVAALQQQQATLVAQQLAAPSLGAAVARYCAHGSVLMTPGAPGVRFADDYGFAVLVHWHAVANYVGYVIELREASSPRFERFSRAMPAPQVEGSFVELRIGGLRPTGATQTYIAQVRSVGFCGCESEASSAVACTGPTAALQMQRQQQAAPSTPPQWHVQMTPQVHPSQLHMCSAFQVPQMPMQMLYPLPSQLPPVTRISLADATVPPLPKASQPRTARERRKSAKRQAQKADVAAPSAAAPPAARLPSLLQSGRGPQASAAAAYAAVSSAPKKAAHAKERSRKDAAANEDDCIVLD